MTQPRSDTFYRFAVGAGLLTALFALVWGSWSLGRSRERLFAIDELLVRARLDVEQQQAEVVRIEAHAAAMNSARRGEPNRSSPRYIFVTRQIERDERRLHDGRTELTRRTAFADLRARQADLVRRSMEIDASRSEGLSALGFTVMVAGLLLWYARHQRHVDAALSDERNRRQQELKSRFPWDEAAVWADDRMEMADREEVSASGGRGGSSPVVPS